MVSEYLKHVRSLEELDKLFAENRLAAAKAAESNFKFEVSRAIISVGEINQVASARITADSQVVSAKIMADAEVISTSLIAKAEVAIFQTQSPITPENISDGADPQSANIQMESVIKNADQEIRDFSNEAIEQIRKEAVDAIERIKANAAAPIEEIRALVADVADRTKTDAEKAAKILAEQKEMPRNKDDMVENAEKAASGLASQTQKNLQDLQEMLDSSIKEITTQTDIFVKEIMKLAKSVEARILACRDEALLRVNQILEKVHKKLP